MSLLISVLPNGLRIVTHTMPHLETTSLGMWVGVGARHEAPHEHGLSHLLEHMAFKGTGTRDARAIAEEIEAVGGELNAATGLETTSYFARVLKGDEAVALGLIADILQNSAFAEEELEKEREVILQEIAATQDSPDDIVFDMVHDIAFPDQPAGRTILGTPGSVKSLSRVHLRNFLDVHYRSAGMVLAVGSVAVQRPSSRATLCSALKVHPTTQRISSRRRSSPGCSVGECHHACSRRSVSGVGCVTRSIRRLGD
jgi:predicted Zn-dependent peptidase